MKNYEFGAPLIDKQHHVNSQNFHEFIHEFKKLCIWDPRNVLTKNGTYYFVDEFIHEFTYSEFINEFIHDFEIKYHDHILQDLM